MEVGCCKGGIRRWGMEDICQGVSHLLQGEGGMEDNGEILIYYKKREDGRCLL